MADLEATETRLSFDDILEAVQDSKRGRWFLQEFENRLQKRDTSSLLAAMARLESRVGELSRESGKPENLNTVTAAIANARNDLLKLGLGKDAMSTEGRLFADLADMARKAMPEAAEGRATIVRALQLVGEIEGAVTLPAAIDRGADFFKPDADLFERRTVHAKPVLVTTPELASPPKPEQASTPPSGAKLVIRRSANITEEGTTPPETTPTIRVEPTILEPVEAPLEKSSIDNPRIVIIRRKAEDMPDVSMDTESAA
jgi:hypothetical protein